MTQKMHHNTSARARPERQVTSAPPSNPSSCFATAWEPDGPTVRFHELLKVVRFGRSTAYKVIKEDPTFPKGTPLFDTPRSPRFWWYDQLIAWLRNREALAGNSANNRRSKEIKHV